MFRAAGDFYPVFTRLQQIFTALIAATALILGILAVRQRAQPIPGAIAIGYGVTVLLGVAASTISTGLAQLIF